MKQIIIVLIVAVSILNHSENLRFLQKESLKEAPVVPNLDDTPEHQQQNKDKKLATKFHEQEDAKEDDWNQIDQGRNWGWNCPKGYEQSPVDIPGIIQKDQEADSRFTIRFGMASPTPALDINITDKHFQVESKDTPLAHTVVHPPEDPDSALSFKMTKMHIKSPSEHTINLQHQPVELQFEHELDLDHSQVRPALASNGVPQQLFVSAMIEAGMEHEFLKAVLDKVPKDEEYKVDVPKKPLEVSEKLEEGASPMYQILGSTQVPEMPEGFSQAAYKGSQTVPPCTENVLWVVLQKPITASAEQIQFIDRMHTTKLSRHLQPHNRRPISHGYFTSSNIKSAMARSVIKKPWFGIQPANMVTPQVKKPKKEEKKEGEEKKE